MAAFFGIREEDQLNQLQLPPPPQQPQQQQSSTPNSSAAVAPAGNQPAPQKKRRNIPGNTPYPDAEVIALSPKTLMATNRFICDVCNKGFQREQNLQLHRRGHNLPWKLKRKNSKEVRRRVYLCPEPSCVHHDPSRALGDLTGIKKHFSRKHGEKKWKCEKCSKKYAVQSDWKAHSKVCGTREYRCDCGTLFSRRDSFITHRAFCDALAQESSRLPNGLNSIGSHLYGNNGMGLGLQSQFSLHMSSLQNQPHSTDDLLPMGGRGLQIDHPPSVYYPGGSSHDFSDDTQSHQSYLQSKPFNGLMELNANASSPSPPSNLFNLGFFSNGGNSSNNVNVGNPRGHLPAVADQFNSGRERAEPTTLFSGSLMSNNHINSGGASICNMSATALLQKAAQMGATTSEGNGSGSSLLRGYGGPSSMGGAKHSSFMESFSNGGSGDQNMRSHMENETSHLQELMNSLSNGGGGGFGGSPSFDGGGRGREIGFGGFGIGLTGMDDGSKLQQNLTRDFLGVGSMMRGMGRGMPQREQQQHHHHHHHHHHQHGFDMDLSDAEMKSSPTSTSHRSFTGGDLQ